MTELETQIWDALMELEQGVAAMKTANPKPNLVPLFNRLTEFSKQLPRATHGRLIEFLVNGSYERAKLWLIEQHGEQACRNASH